MRQFWRAIAIGIFIALLIHLAPTVAQQRVEVRVNRWLEVRQVSGAVTLQRSGRAGTAHVGDRLQAVGEGMTTGAGASAQLVVDTNVGVVNVASNTTFHIETLRVAPDNGRITRLSVTQGQVRLQVRRFTNSGSALEILTPSGISGVRGTDFGVAVQPNGKTGLATLEGSVATSAQGQSELVRRGYQNFTIPGEPPSPPVPLTEDTRLNYRFVPEIERGVRKLRLNGQVDPVNAVFVDGEPQVTDRQGRFSTLLLVPSHPRYRVLVVTPLGKRQEHELAFE